MSRILVVEDSATQALQIRLLLEDAGFTVSLAGHGREALGVLAREAPDVVLTDLDMPEMNGLELVAAIRRDYSAVPVILMTAMGSEEVAVKALREGAANYVPKRKLESDIVSTLEDVLAVARASQCQQRILGYLEETEFRFVLDNDPSLVPPFIGHLEEQLSHLQACNRTDLMRTGIALQEALLNAIHHGNLEVSSELRQEDESVYHELAEARRRQPPYCDRRVHVSAHLSRAASVYVVEDEGSGFDPSKLPDPSDPANLERVGGRGLTLIRTFMDEVHHNARGNQIVLHKRCRQRPVGSAS